MDGGQVAAQYTSGTLEQTILTALERSGKNLDALTPQDLAPLDQLHSGGRPATLEMARLAGIGQGMRVLDIGGGIGGPARLLASEFGCQVTVLDLTPEFCKTGEALTRRVGLGDRVTFVQGSGLNVPFDDESFDVAWTQHSTMNIEDKARLFQEIHRVLRPGGKYVLHEIAQGPNQPIHFPAPWARDPSVSFLATPDEYQRLITSAGFRQIAWNIRGRDPAQQPPILPQGQSTVGIHVLGPDMPERLRNAGRNDAEGRTVVIQGVFERV